jgi:hypothetical protein
MIVKSVLILIVTYFVSLPFSFGQGAIVDTTFADRSFANAARVYNSSIRDQSLLYNGIEYKPFPEPYDGHPFFESEYVEEGTVFFDGEVYEGMPIQYDLLSDLLILEHYDQLGYVGMMQPHQEKITQFSLLNHTFILVDGDSTGGMLKDGFYDLLYNGSVKILAKRKKSVVRDFENSQIKISFPQKNGYFLMKDNQYFPIKNKSSIVRALKANKRLFKQFITKNQLDFNENKENSIVALAAYYDQIQN